MKKDRKRKWKSIIRNLREKVKGESREIGLENSGDKVERESGERK